MKLPKIKNPIFMLLLIIVIIVWGIIISRVISYFYGDEDSEVEIIEEVIPDNIFSSRSKTSEVELGYVKLDKDPFVLVPVKKVVKKKIKKPVKVEPKEQLNFIVNGVLINNKSRTALIIDQTNNETVFLKEGSEYKSIRVISISSTEIKVKENGETRAISFSNTSQSDNPENMQ